MLSKNDKGVSMSDTVFAQHVVKEAFPRERYGSVKAAQLAAYDYLRRRLSGNVTLRRVRSIWEGKAKRIDGQEKDALRRAQIEEARNEYQALRGRLASLEAALAVADPAFFGPEMDAYREMAAPMGLNRRAGSDRTPGG